jgi:hypothetical protein
MKMLLPCCRDRKCCPCRPGTGGKLDFDVHFSSHIDALRNLESPFYVYIAVYQAIANPTSLELDGLTTINMLRGEGGELSLSLLVDVGAINTSTTQGRRFI